MAPSAHLLLLTYTPREDVDERGYDDWVRDVDNPFWMGVPGIVHYTSWKIARPLVGSVPFTHLDLMFLDGPDGFERVFGRQDAIDFAREWCDLWGATPDADDLAASNAEMHLFEPVEARPDHWRRTDTLVASFLAPSPTGDGDPGTWHREVAWPAISSRPGVASLTGWSLAAAKVGPASFTRLSLLFLDDPAALAGLAADPEVMQVADRWLDRFGPGGDAGLASALPTVLCELIAAPD
ncbi:MAG: hypothetical protein R3C15_18600 [Thermoleophilia bacterium]